MAKNKLDYLFGYLEFVELRGRYLLFRDGELFDTERNTSEYYTSTDAMLAAELVDGETVAEALDALEIIELEGGRGASSEMGGGFTSAGDSGGKDDPGYGKILYPATFNTQGRFASQEGAIALFAERYGGAEREYGISVDSQGFVHRHVQGGPTSVPIRTAGQDHMIVHNHPGGGAFSKADLRGIARDRMAKGIVATGTKETYRLTKGPRFDAKGFAKAVGSAKWPRNLSYDDGADWWLKRNAKTYGYTYARTKQK